MMDERLKSEYKKQILMFIFNVATILASVLVIVFMWVVYALLVSNAMLNLFWQVYAVFLIIALSILIAISIHNIFGVNNPISFLRDWKAVRNRSTLTITGVVREILKVDEGGGDSPNYVNYAIVQDSKTGKEVRLRVDNVMKGFQYTFQYLKHTKYAVVVLGELSSQTAEDAEKPKEDETPYNVIAPEAFKDETDCDGNK